MKPCQPWVGRTQTGRGYGYLYVAGKRWIAHRWVFLQTHGYLPEVVRHTCDNEACVEPTHLLAGTQADNIRDMHERGRARKARGQAVNTAKLTVRQVRKIRLRLTAGDPIAALARDYGVDRKTIRQIRDRKHWHWLD